MEQNTDEGRMYSRRATQGYKPNINGDMKYLDHYGLHTWS